MKHIKDIMQVARENQDEPQLWGYALCHVIGKLVYTPADNDCVIMMSVLKELANYLGMTIAEFEKGLKILSDSDVIAIESNRGSILLLRPRKLFADMVFYAA